VERKPAAAAAAAPGLKVSEIKVPALKEKAAAAPAGASAPKKDNHPLPSPVDIEAPAAPCLIARPLWEEGAPARQVKAALLSLDGLLDYNLDDKLERAFELSLFAELYHEMLQAPPALSLQPRCSLVAASLQPRCSLDAASMLPRCCLDAASLLSCYCLDAASLLSRCCLCEDGGG
jgi:hypothetical protein